MAAKVLFLVMAVFTGQSLASTIHLNNSRMTLTGTGIINVNPVEKFWSGISHTRRYPLILSGDLIALKLDRSSGTPRWIQCSKKTYCTTSTCPGGQVMLNSKFSSCPTVVFRIRTLGKQDGQAVEAGDYVHMTFPTLGEKRFFHCHLSTSSPCNARWLIGQAPLPRMYWFHYNQVKFQIFAKNAIEGRPIQYGDIVGFRYDVQSNTAWLYSDGSKVYARSCFWAAYYNKSHCTKTNSGFAFKIYKKL